MKKLLFFTAILLALLPAGCRAKPEPSMWEGSSAGWDVSMELPASPDGLETVAFTFLPRSPERLFVEDEVIGFSVGTSAGSAVYSYHQTDGYIRSPYPQESEWLERVERISGDAFEVDYDAALFSFGEDTAEQRIVCKVSNGTVETIEMKAVS